MRLHDRDEGQNASKVVHGHIKDIPGNFLSSPPDFRAGTDLMIFPAICLLFELTGQLTKFIYHEARH